MVLYKDVSYLHFPRIISAHLPGHPSSAETIADLSFDLLRYREAGITISDSRQRHDIRANKREQWEQDFQEGY